MSKARTGVVAMSVLMSISLLSGCGNDSASDGGADTGDNGQVEEGTSNDESDESGDTDDGDDDDADDNDTDDDDADDNDS